MITINSELTGKYVRNEMTPGVKLYVRMRWWHNTVVAVVVAITIVVAAIVCVVFR